MTERGMGMTDEVRGMTYGGSGNDRRDVKI